MTIYMVVISPNIQVEFSVKRYAAGETPVRLHVGFTTHALDFVLSIFIDILALGCESIELSEKRLKSPSLNFLE